MKVTADSGYSQFTRQMFPAGTTVIAANSEYLPIISRISSVTIIYWEAAMSTGLLTQLKALHLHGMAEAWSELSAEMPQRKQVPPETILSQLINAGIADRQLRSLKYRIKLQSFGFTAIW